MIILAWTLILLVTASAALLIGLNALKQARREEETRTAGSNDSLPPSSMS